MSFPTLINKPLVDGFPWIDSVFNGGAAAEVCVPLWQPNGVNQCMVFNAVNLVAGDVITCDFVGNNTPAFSRVFGSANFNFSVDVGTTGNEFRTVGCTALLDGAPIVSGVTPVPNAGIHSLHVTVNVTTSISAIGCLTGSSRYSSLYLYNFRINDGSQHNYPLADGLDNNPTARNLGAAGNGSYQNNDVGAWGQRCE